MHQTDTFSNKPNPQTQWVGVEGAGNRVGVCWIAY